MRTRDVAQRGNSYILLQHSSLFMNLPIPPLWASVFLLLLTMTLLTTGKADLIQAKVQTLTNHTPALVLRMPPPIANHTQASGQSESISINQVPQLYQNNQTVIRPFSFLLTLYRIDSSTGQVAVVGKAQNVTRFTVFNATDHDAKDGNSNGITDIIVRFPNMTLNAGEQFQACVLVVKDLKNICNTSYKEPGSRGDHVNISVKDG